MDNLNISVQYLKGVGPRYAMVLEKLGIVTLKDLIYHFPMRYEDRGNFMTVSSAPLGEYATFRGRIVSAENRATSRKNFIITRAVFTDGTGEAVLTWFNQKFIKTKLDRILGQTLILYGQITFNGYNREIKSPKFETENENTASVGRIVPIYPCTEGVDGDRLRTLIHNAVKENIHHIREFLPKDIREKYHLMGLGEALINIHFPENEEKREEARRRLVFDELFLIQTGLALKRKRNTVPGEGIVFGVPEGFSEELKKIIPFELTDAQKRCIKEILSDMRKNASMNRLLQGDVGSGKTVVALASMLFCVRNGYQAVFMAPTEILARQHYKSLTDMLKDFGVLDINVCLLKGSMKSRERRETLAAIENGSADIIVGTHALISENVVYKNPGLVIIDEQHKFGVMQRGKLKDKGKNPDVLVMTATPIPRTLTLMVYGDLAVSVIDEMPKGRKPVITHHKTRDERVRVYESLTKLLDRGEQAFVVCPLVEESENLQAKAAGELFEELRDMLPDYSVGLVHGKMKGDDKDRVMEDFRKGDIQILVSTTVIEVGVDVPNANTIIVEDAERFGLSQLHQLRGRVGRGGKQGFCILISDALGEDAKKRMEIMTETGNGFRIAEEDLILRGPGEFTGTKQSGMDGLKIADIFRDTAILQEAREAAQNLIDRNPGLLGEEYALLRGEFRQNFEKIDIAGI
ncbi:MAG: ATP-dependent DNA helicase RecG [Armatimonadetes bacterium]|nr:ATP-dependent DNA helicase RecG [Candidatus Hippobium faecium]